MRTATREKLEMQLRLLALNGLFECARAGLNASSVPSIILGLADAEAETGFDIEAVDSLDFLFRDRPKPL